MPARDLIRSVPCPQCGAPADEKCREGGRLINRHHPKRVGRAEMLLGWQAPGESPYHARLRERWRTGRYGQR
jgi:hypothetical protein